MGFFDWMSKSKKSHEHERLERRVEKLEEFRDIYYGKVNDTLDQIRKELDRGVNGWKKN